MMRPHKESTSSQEPVRNVRMKYFNHRRNKENKVYSTDNPKELPRLAFRAVFYNEPFVYRGMFQTKTMISKTKRLNGLNIGNWLYLQQNPFTKSSWARKAREREMILWIIHKPTNTWCFRVDSKTVHRLPGADKLSQKARTA